VQQKKGCVAMAQRDEQQVLHSIVRIHSYGKKVNMAKPYKTQDRKKGVGTGTFVMPPPGSPLASARDVLFVLTCAHVVESADTVSVLLPMLSQNRQVSASTLSFVPEFDLAIVAVPDADGELRKAVHVLQLGTSDGMPLRSRLTAFGFPMGQTALKASEGVYAGYQRMLQHTVSISPGNSGGPLLDSQNRIVGINNSGLVAPTASDIYYAVPIELYKLQRDRLFSVPVGPPGPERVMRVPSYGLCYQESTRAQLAALSNVCRSGVYVYKVLPGSPVAESGISTGAVVCAFDELHVENTGELQVPWNYQKVQLTDVLMRATGGKHAVTFAQNGAAYTVRVAPRDLDVHGLKMLYPPFDTVDYVAFAGVCMMNLCKNHVKTPVTMSAYVFQEPEQLMQPQVIITHIFSGSHADTLDTVTKGDLVTHVNGVEVTCLEEVRDALGRAGEGVISIQVKRGERLVLSVREVLEEEASNAASALYRQEAGVLQKLSVL
jgi:S1-C subfamily serine protease